MTTEVRASHILVKTKEEAEARSLLFEARIQKLRDFGGDEKIFKDHFYLVIYDHDHESLNVTADSMISTMSRGLVPISATRLRDQELAVFLKSNYTKDFNEGDLSVVTMADYAKWSIPEKIVFKAGRTIIDGQDYRSFSIYDYPLNVGNAWAWPFFNLDGCRVNILLKPSYLVNSCIKELNLLPLEISKSLDFIRQSGGNKASHSPLLESRVVESSDLRKCIDHYKNVIEAVWSDVLPSKFQMALRGEIESIYQLDLQNDIWNNIQMECNYFSKESRYVLISPPSFSDVTLNQLKCLASIKWNFIIDFNPDSKENGLYKAFSDKVLTIWEYAHSHISFSLSFLDATVSLCSVS